MSATAWVVSSLAAATPSPSPSDVLVSESTGGSPGFLGFVFTFALAVACVGIFLSLTRQLRRVDRRAKQLEEPDAAVRQADGEGGAGGSGAAPDLAGDVAPDRAAGSEDRP